MVLTVEELIFELSHHAPYLKVFVKDVSNQELRIEEVVLTDKVINKQVEDVILLEIE